MKTVLITGTSSGIGYETALAFARTGYHVIATMRDVEKNDLRKIATQEKLNIDIKQLDVVNTQSVQNVIDNILQQTGQIDILINNAGSGFRGALEQTTLSQAQAVMDINFFGTWRLVQAVLPSMRKNKSGRIISVTSIGGVIGHPFNDAYCAAKFAVEGMMESLAPVVKQFGIHVSLVEPGPVNSSFASSTLHKSPELPTELESDYGTMLATYAQATKNVFAQLGQAPDEVANTLLEIATAEQPKFRYQTSEFSKQLVELKLTDATGNKIIELSATRLQS